MDEHQYDLAVIGGGSGGLACAQRAAEYGARAIVVESGRLGGTCVNVGCVPKKIMWNAAQIAEALIDAPDYGFHLETMGQDWPALKRKRDEFILRLNAHYERNLGQRQVEIARGHARFTAPRTLVVAGREIRASHVVIATGGRPLIPDIEGAGLGMTSDGFFELDRRPQRVAVVGSGYIAVELAGIFAALASQVTLVLRSNGVLKQFDSMLGEAALAEMREDGTQIVIDASPESLVRTDGGLVLNVRGGRGLGPFDCVLWAIGRVPNVFELGLNHAGVALDSSGFIVTDAYQATNVAGVYAIGDVTGRLPLTPVAIAAGRRLSDRLFGGQPQRRLDYENVPTVIFGHPAIGTVGLSETTARRLHGEAVKVFTSSFVPLYHAMTSRKPRTHMKLITIGAQERIVGAHVIGPGADEMLQGFAVALQMGASKGDLDDTVAIHPTSAEEFVTMR